MPYHTITLMVELGKLIITDAYQEMHIDTHMLEGRYTDEEEDYLAMRWQHNALVEKTLSRWRQQHHYIRLARSLSFPMQNFVPLYYWDITSL